MTQAASSARAIADVSTGTILAQVEIAAPIERVFAALTRGDEIVKWWGSADLYRTTEWTSDLRAGGAWKSSGVGADGAPFSVGGEYLAVEPPTLVKFTWRPTWAPGVSTVSYRLEPIDGGTRVVLRHEGLTDPDSCRNHTRGWERIFGWLTGYVVAPVQTKHVMARLVPPRPDFAMTMTPAEREVMGRHVMYCKSLIDRGKGLLFGPVADPTAGVWGCGILLVSDDAEAQALLAADPAVTSGIGARYEFLPFLNIMR